MLHLRPDQSERLADDLEFQVKSFAQPAGPPLRPREQMGRSAAHLVLVLQETVNARHVENLARVVHALPGASARRFGKILQAQRGEAAHEHRRTIQTQGGSGFGVGQHVAQFDRAGTGGGIGRQADETDLPRVDPAVHR